MGKTKKVIFFLVEGPTDESALSPVLKRIFSSSEVHFHIIHGDITLENGITAQYAIKYVADRIDAEMGKYAYRRSDILQIVHLIDTDGVFISPELVKPMADNGIRYCKDHIETGTVEAVQYRNQKKSAVVSKLCAAPKMLKTIPYSIYYFSRNMEHVLHNREENLTKEQKIELADAFADCYENKPEEFLLFIKSGDVAAEGTYGQTWDFIRRGVNSLNRYSNLHLLFAQENLK